MSDRSRRSFLRGLAGLFGAATFPDLEARVLDAGKPILLQPSAVSSTIFVAEHGGLFFGDHDHESFPRVSWRQYFADLGARTPGQFASLASTWGVTDLDALVGDRYWGAVYESRYDPMPAAYHRLRELRIGTALRSKGRTAGRLDFRAGSNHPGSTDLWVEAADDLSVSLLQANLIELGQPVRLVMEAPTIIKPDEFHADGEAWDE
jgi:hypothetical protein